MGYCDIQNCSFFLLPLSCGSQEKLKAFLNRSECWTKTDHDAETNYLLSYVDSLVRGQDGRMSVYAYRDAESLPLVSFRNRISEKQKAEFQGNTLTDQIRLYLFETGIAFLEFRILYQNMTLEEIEWFIYLFRSLRNNETKAYLHFDEGEISLKSAAERILPEQETGVRVCFANSSDVKAQADVYSIIQMDRDAAADPDPAGTVGTAVNPDPSKTGEAAAKPDSSKLREAGFRITHGYSPEYAYHGGQKQDASETEEKYEMSCDINGDYYWSGCQDGFSCIVVKPFSYQFQQLCNDYHMIYLLLLNQRFSSLLYIQQMADPQTDAVHLQELHQKTVDLKTRYSYRIVSDDRIAQKIFHQMHQVLELDELLEDIREMNEQMIQIRETEQEKSQKRFEKILTVLSVLTVFSTLIDFSSYLDRWNIDSFWATLTSLVVTAAVAAVSAVLVFWKRLK